MEELTATEVTSGHQLVSVLAFDDYRNLRRSLVSACQTRQLHLSLTVVILADLLRSCSSLQVVRICLPCFGR